MEERLNVQILMVSNRYLMSATGERGLRYMPQPTSFHGFINHIFHRCWMLCHRHVVAPYEYISTPSPKFATIELFRQWWKWQSKMCENIPCRTGKQWKWIYSEGKCIDIPSLLAYWWWSSLKTKDWILYSLHLICDLIVGLCFFTHNIWINFFAAPAFVDFDIP